MIGFSFQSSISVWQTIYFTKFIRVLNVNNSSYLPFCPPQKEVKIGEIGRCTKELEGVEKEVHIVVGVIACHASKLKGIGVIDR